MTNPAFPRTALFALTALTALTACARGAGSNDVQASGTVEATDARLGFVSGGRIESLLVREGDAVKAGALLAVLDTAEAGARLQAARAQLQSSRALLSELERGSRPEEIATGRAALDAAQKSLVDADSDLVRARTLAATGVVSRQVLDKATAAQQIAQSRYDQAHAQLDLLETGPRRERIAAQRSQMDAAQAQVTALEAGLTNMRIVAPFDGIATVRHRESGEAVTPGAPVYTLVNPGDRWVRIYVPENRIGAVRLGQKAEITSDSYRDRRFAGSVSYIATEAEFTPRNVQTTEERVKLVYAVKVRIESDTAVVLKPGTPADVRLLQ